MEVHRGTPSDHIGHRGDEEVLQKVPSLKLVNESFLRPSPGREHTAGYCSGLREQFRFRFRFRFRFQAHRACAS
jgi:hypothetical protein